ncbi:hypothetical protein BABINDRAFT_160286 [Babjeviella inositovora NRRL Y-12698]|uniref:Ammonia transport outward protein 2 n=1 Tax=Babjeviella inositovora NRRL Y-12698 TaxID=984486 RepID=A0A1E3QWR9_9ASCO|nr:uncharacterized protein BABINDRAFT_160286 [Babjeviella inositovora NRRL Y-12698]ODQ82090.1 hypothetical protein BABINDRAFT_160286 [Babjeviella inositovora NRRL Y-12698]
MSQSHTSSSQGSYHEEEEFGKVEHGNDGTRAYVIIGKQKFLKEDLAQAFGGNFQVEQYAPAPSRKFGNPAPLGLSAFALTTFVLSMINARAMGISHANVVVGLALFYGGFIQLLAGMWEIAVENTFGGVALSSYGGFWMSWAALNVPWFGISTAYTDSKEHTNAIAFFLLGWTIFTFMLWLCTMKSTWAFFALFSFLLVTFILLTIGDFTGKLGVTRAGGVFGVITAFIAWYNAYAGIANPQNTYVHVKAVAMPSFA